MSERKMRVVVADLKKGRRSGIMLVVSGWKCGRLSGER